MPWNTALPRNWAPTNTATSPKRAWWNTAPTELGVLNWASPSNWAPTNWLDRTALFLQQHLAAS